RTEAPYIDLVAFLYEALYIGDLDVAELGEPHGGLGERLENRHFVGMYIKADPERFLGYFGPGYVGYVGVSIYYPGYFEARFFDLAEYVVDLLARVYEYPLVHLFVAEYVAVRKKNTAGYTPKNHSLNLLRKSVYYEMRELARSRRP